ncbi:MAG: helix-turn-helix transcriptional regulator [Parvularculaceae bacterium]|nr:helix-turn-helix transcriptional regulator [Parvularculaceae bacterium]
MPTPHTPPLAVRRALEKLGEDIFDARKRRKLSAQVVAERAHTSRNTLKRIEEGDPAVSIGIYASVLNALGLLQGVAELADPARDRLGLELTSPSAKRRAGERRGEDR